MITENYSIDLKLFATLNRFALKTPDPYPISTGMTVEKLLNRLGIPLDQVKLIFIDGVKGNLSSVLKGNERVGIFPPVGGG